MHFYNSVCIYRYYPINLCSWISTFNHSDSLKATPFSWILCHNLCKEHDLYFVFLIAKCLLQSVFKFSCSFTLFGMRRIRKKDLDKQKFWFFHSLNFLDIWFSLRTGHNMKVITEWHIIYQSYAAFSLL